MLRLILNFFLVHASLFENFAQGSLRQVFAMKRNHNPSSGFRMEINSMTAFAPVENKTLLFEDFDNLLRREGRGI